MASIRDIAARLWSRRRDGETLVVGLTGGVGCGKSTLAESLARAFADLPGAPHAEVVNTDGFLFPNAILTERGLLNRKGFPETYDRAAMARTLTAARRGPASFPVYSHLTYDVDPALARRIDRPDVLIVEGLGLDERAGVDVLLFLDAPDEDQIAWFVERFMRFWEQGLSDDSSFYARFRNLDEAGARGLARMVWDTINGPNLHEFIAPVRDHADLVVCKAPDHAIARIVERPSDR
jgi:type I pantothenate kinase